MTDFISQFMLLTESTRSPELFRLWSAISLIAGALEQRVWIKNGDDIAFPNMYIILVAPPGVGKDIVERVRDLWAETCEPGTKIPSLHVAPDSMTKASMIDSVVKASRTFLGTSGPPLKYHHLSIAAEEFSIFLPAYDMEFIGVLNSFWGKKALHEEVRRYGSAREVRIERPQLNILGGIQPAYLASIFPEEAWNTGLARRLFMIYSTDTPHRSLFYESSVPLGIREEVLRALGRMSGAYGQMKWEPEAMHALDKWFMSGPPLMGGNPVPTHQKLQHYIRGRGLTSLKLSMIAAISRDQEELVIREEDVKRALHWLLEAERMMPDIFRAMVGKSDKDVLSEMHLYVVAKAAASKGQVKGSDIRRFLLERVPHEKVEGLIMAAFRSLIIDRVAGEEDVWVPKARYDSGAE